MPTHHHSSRIARTQAHHLLPTSAPPRSSLPHALLLADTTSRASTPSSRPRAWPVHAHMPAMPSSASPPPSPVPPLPSHAPTALACRCTAIPLPFHAHMWPIRAPIPTTPSSLSPPPSPAPPPPSHAPVVLPCCCAAHPLPFCARAWPFRACVPMTLSSPFCRCLLHLCRPRTPPLASHVAALAHDAHFPVSAALSPACAALSPACAALVRPCWSRMLPIHHRLLYLRRPRTPQLASHVAALAHNGHFPVLPPLLCLRRPRTPPPALHVAAPPPHRRSTPTRGRFAPTCGWFVPFPVTSCPAFSTTTSTSRALWRSLWLCGALTLSSISPRGLALRTVWCTMVPHRATPPCRRRSDPSVAVSHVTPLSRGPRPCLAVTCPCATITTPRAAVMCPCGTTPPTSLRRPPHAPTLHPARLSNGGRHTPHAFSARQTPLRRPATAPRAVAAPCLP
ncbi:hypothetical protein DENSPDRAFT_887123 [Dentipellis sp. KUC8613]|nr:hypothetical protein DENSPDRAFT_887123 [Dentipellis sp. KUC8613]